MPAEPDDAFPKPDMPAGAALDHEQLAQIRAAQELLTRFIEVVESDGRYPLDAFRFLQESLDHAVKKVHGPNAGLTKARDGSGGRNEPDDNLDDHPHHISACELCEGLGELAVQRWGRLAKTVLGTWNIHATRDVGEMVFLLVRNDLLRKTEDDRQEDFNDLFPFSRLETAYNIHARDINVEEVHAAGAS